VTSRERLLIESGLPFRRGLRVFFGFRANQEGFGNPIREFLAAFCQGGGLAKPVVTNITAGWFIHGRN
jgi:hypothetical protein